MCLFIFSHHFSTNSCFAIFRFIDDITGPSLYVRSHPLCNITFKSFHQVMKSRHYLRFICVKIHPECICHYKDVGGSIGGIGSVLYAHSYLTYQRDRHLLHFVSVQQPYCLSGQYCWSQNGSYQTEMHHFAKKSFFPWQEYEYMYCVYVYQYVLCPSSVMGRVEREQKNIYLMVVQLSGN